MPTQRFFFSHTSSLFNPAKETVPNHTSIVQLVHSFSLTPFLSHFLAVSCSINFYCLQLNLKCLFSVFKKVAAVEERVQRESAIAQSLFFKLRRVCVSWPFASYIYKRRHCRCVCALPLCTLSFTFFSTNTAQLNYRPQISPGARTNEANGC